jgi:hypothetical protein
MDLEGLIPLKHVARPMPGKERTIRAIYRDRRKNRRLGFLSD